MACSRRCGWVFLVLAVLLCGTARPQDPISPACDRTCPARIANPFDPKFASQNAAAVECEAKEASCQTALTLYQYHMSQLSLGAQMKQLPDLYVELLQPLFANLSLAKVRFGFASLPTLTVTDCSRIYAGNAILVNGWADGSTTRDVDLRTLLHALEHAQQCSKVGGRDAYAIQWYGEVNPQTIAGGNMLAIHNAMPTEAETNARAAQMLNTLAVNRDREGKLVRALKLTLVHGADSSPFGSLPFTVYKDGTQAATLTLRAEITGGSDLNNVEWRALRSGSLKAQVVQSSLIRQFTFTTSELGAHEVRARVGQEGSGLVPADALARINVVAVPDWEGLSASGTIGKSEEQRWQTPMLGAGYYQFDLSGTGGDADLYVRTTSPPTMTGYDCRPAKNGSNESCIIQLTQPRVIHIMVRGYAPSSVFSLVGSENDHE